MPLKTTLKAAAASVLTHQQLVPVCEVPGPLWSVPLSTWKDDGTRLLIQRQACRTAFWESG